MKRRTGASDVLQASLELDLRRVEDRTDERGFDIDAAPVRKIGDGAIREGG